MTEEEKKEEGVAILSREEMEVRQIHAESNSEIVSIELSLGEEKIVMNKVYVPPFTKTWGALEHEVMLESTLKDLEQILKEVSKRNL